MRGFPRRTRDWPRVTCLQAAGGGRPGVVVEGPFVAGDAMSGLSAVSPCHA